MTRCIILPAAFLLFFPSIQTQSQISDSAFNLCVKNEKLEILREDFNISFVGQKAEYIEVVFEKDIIYKILNDPSALLPFELPENQDPTYTPHGSGIRNTCRLFDDVKIDYFEASLIKPDGSKQLLPSGRVEKDHRIVTDRDMFGQLYTYLYDAEGLEKGDLVNIRYKYSVRYIYNYFKMFSYRLFLHGIHPRKEYNLTLTHHFDLEVDTFFMNSGKPVKDIQKDIITYTWKLVNLPGCLDEPGSRPYHELPWITITVKPYELLYQDFNSFRETFVPMWYYLSGHREGLLRSAIDDANFGTKDRDNLAFDKVAARYINMAEDDSTGIDRLRYFQRYMVDSVTYENDFDYYNGDEAYLKDHPGIQLLGQKVKDHLKDFVYASVIPKLDLQFFTAYVADSRSGAMSIEYYAPVYDNETLFAPVLKNNTLAYLLPKSDYRNLYCEELPFYYENAPVLLIYAYDFAGYKRNFNELVRIVNTPASYLSDNFRKTNNLVAVDLENNLITFNSKISLSGQYSTLTRNNYTDKAMDSTINPRYLMKVWETGGNAEILDAHLNGADFIFPYQASATANYRFRDMISKEENGYSIDIGKWTRHIIIENFSSSERFTNFYPDFLGSDSYATMMVFDKEVNLSKVPGEINIDNEFAIFKYSVKQLDPTRILLNSYFVIKSPMVEVSKTKLVESIYKAIENSEESSIQFSTN